MADLSLLDKLHHGPFAPSLPFLSDGYKPSHWKMTPVVEGFTHSYFSSRDEKAGPVLWYGLQGQILSQFNWGAGLFNLKKVKDWFDNYMGPDVFHTDGWARIYEMAKHQRFTPPVIIRALPEGVTVPPNVPLLTIENEDPRDRWIVNYLEDVIVHNWYTTTVATNSRNLRKVILAHLEKSGTPEEIDFKLHDFGLRSCTSMETAGRGGSAHAINFMGSDTLPGAFYAMEYYGSPDGRIKSIPASEHMCPTSWGKANEDQFFCEMISRFKKEGRFSMLALVMDTWDVFRTWEFVCQHLYPKYLKGENFKLVGRPDSGEIHATLLSLLAIAEKHLPIEKNKKGYKVLPRELGLIWGDGIKLNVIDGIFTVLENAGWSSDVLALGMGSGLLQELARDDYGFAMKASYTEEWVDGKCASRAAISKDPVTSKGKRSHAGLLGVAKVDGQYKTVNFGTDREAYQAFCNSGQNELKVVYQNHNLVTVHSFEEIVQRAKL